MPRKRTLKVNQGLPKRWRYRYGAYYYMVPLAQRADWGGKREYRLGRTLAAAHETFSRRLKAIEGRGKLSDLIDRYTREVTPHKGSPRTRKDEYAIFKRLRAMIGGNRAVDFKTQHCYQVYELLKPRGLTTANRHMEKLSHLFTKALEWGAISDHPMVGKFRKSHPTPARTYITDDQIRESMESAPALIRAYLGLKLLTGLRQTDLLRLKVRDWRDDGLHVTPSKTRKSSGMAIIFERTPALEAAVAAILALPRPDITEHLFCTRAGAPYLKADGSTNGFQSIWGRWQRGKVKHRFKERDIRVKVGSDAETDEAAAMILGHAPGSATTRKHYRAKPMKVRPAR